ncbi:unnamed protein product [Arctogadus glacialis]
METLKQSTDVCVTLSLHSGLGQRRLQKKLFLTEARWVLRPSGCMAQLGFDHDNVHLHSVETSSLASDMRWGASKDTVQ